MSNKNKPEIEFADTRMLSANSFIVSANENLQF